jgi:hypothetical protein
MKKRNNWTVTEDNILRQLRIEGVPYPEIQRRYLPKRTVTALRTRATYIGVYKQQQAWEPYEEWVIHILKRKTNLNNEEIGELLNRTKGSINNHASKYGLCTHAPAGDMPAKAWEIVNEVLDVR